MLAETISVTGDNGDSIHAYFSRPLGKGPFPGVLLIPHKPGWDEMYREITRRFTQHGYLAVCPNIYSRYGHGYPDEVADRALAAGGVPDTSVMGDCEGSIEYLRAHPNSNGKVGVIGTCSGGRHAFLAACTLNGIDAAVDCWGGGVVASEAELSPARPVSPIDYTPKLSCPLLGIFGNDDMYPTPEKVDLHEEELKKYNKDYEFHRYDGASHGFWYYHTDFYRPRQAMDAWAKVFDFFGRHLNSTSPEVT